MPRCLRVRLTTQLALALTVTSSAILTGYGAWEFRQEEIDLRAATEHDVKLLGTAVQIAIENALRDGQSADVSEVLDSLELKDATIDVFVFDAARHLSTSSSTSPDARNGVDAIAAEVAATRHTVTLFEGPRGLTRLVTGVPLRADDGTGLGVVVLVRPLDELRRDLLAMAESRLFTILTLITGLAVIGWLLIRITVQRPLDRLIAAMGAVREGNLVTSLPLGGGPELARVVGEFNAMVTELGHARARLVAEGESRQALEAGLQRVDKLVTVGQLSAGLAHEIGSPLLVLNGRASALAARADVQPDVRRTAQILVEQSDRITTIVEQLVSFARKRSARIEGLDPRTPVDAIVELVSADARKKGLTLELNVEPSLPRILADAQQVQQVVLNLLTNAFRATPRGGWVKVGLAASSFAQADGAPQPSICLTVHDNGSGIDKGLQSQVFEPFFTTWENAGGAGLGLSVVKAIVTEHKGSLALESTSEGTRFSIHFPQQGPA